MAEFSKRRVTFVVLNDIARVYCRKQSGGYFCFVSFLICPWWLNNLPLPIYVFSARGLDVVVLQPSPKASGQRAADHNDFGGHAVLSTVKDVPDKDGCSQCGQEARPNVQVARPGQAGVGSDTIESHQANDQNKT